MTSEGIWCGVMPRELSGQGHSTSPLFEERIAAIICQLPRCIQMYRWRLNLGSRVICIESSRIISSLWACFNFNKTVHFYVSFGRKKSVHTEAALSCYVARADFSNANAFTYSLLSNPQHFCSISRSLVAHLIASSLQPIARL
jgi:hypothetical protein